MTVHITLRTSLVSSPHVAMQGGMNTEAGTVHCCGRDDRVESPSSHQYAVQVALVTMKERCQKLQERLICLERENAMLKASRCQAADGSANKPSSVMEAQLRDKIAKLQSQKSHLTHQIFIVASENKQLFDRLSRLTEANRSLGGHLSRISNTLSRHDLTASMEQSMSASALQTVSETHPLQKSSQSLSPSDLSSVSLRPEPEGAGTTGEQGPKEESLEEISSKLIQSILQAKADLQSQYEQMVELQSDHSDEGGRPDRSTSHLAVRDLGFSFQNHKTVSEDAVDEAEEEMRALSEKLAATRETLLQQQEQMRALVAAYSSCKVRCEECEERRQEQGELDSLKLWGSGEHASYSSNDAHPNTQVTEFHNKSNSPLHTEVVPAGASTDEIVGNVATVSRSTQCMQDGCSMRQTEREVPDGQSASCEKMCPLCSKLYGPECSFKEFHNHVMSHFPDTDEEDEVTANYVIVQPTVGF